MNNNPISNIDPHGDLFFAIPQISFNGGFSIGLEVGVGLPGVLSASVTGGYSTAGGGSAYWSVQGNAGGLYGGYGSGGAFGGYGYQTAGFSAGYDFASNSISASYGVGGKGLTTFGGSAGLSYNFDSNEFGYNVGGSYTHIFEKPIVEYQITYEDKDASSIATDQGDVTHDCLLRACEYMGPYGYDDIKSKLGDVYEPGVGTRTKEGLELIYGEGNIEGPFKEINPVKSNRTWSTGGNVLVAENRNHALVLNKIEQYKTTYKYRRQKTQTKFIYTFMNPATGKFPSSGLRRNYKYPTFYIKK